MPLLLLDLDNTVADRAAAFGHWLDRVIERAQPGDAAAVRAYLTELDADGTYPRPAFLRAAGERLGTPLSLEEYRAVKLAGFPRLPAEVAGRVRALRRGGWRIAVVTNGDAEAQERTIRHIGLDHHLDACVVSGAVGVRKPDPEIFRLAVEAAGPTPPPTWMVGDAVVDVAGARAAGLPSIWIARSRRWAVSEFAPDAVAPDLAAALDMLPA